MTGGFWIGSECSSIMGDLSLLLLTCFFLRFPYRLTDCQGCYFLDGLRFGHCPFLRIFLYMNMAMERRVGRVWLKGNEWTLLLLFFFLLLLLFFSFLLFFSLLLLLLSLLLLLLQCHGSTPPPGPGPPGRPRGTPPEKVMNIFHVNIFLGESSTKRKGL